ncbi:hypothetical protein ASG51_04310 [Methylobacterium sp. Leaf465]|nr:hypothetical protein ASG51_04310 [Methylobacterium sp. Leaf465]
MHVDRRFVQIGALTLTLFSEMTAFPRVGPPGGLGEGRVRGSRRARPHSFGKPMATWAAQSSADQCRSRVMWRVASPSGAKVTRPVESGLAEGSRAGTEAFVETIRGFFIGSRLKPALGISRRPGPA